MSAPVLRWEPVSGRVRVRACGETVVDTTKAKLLHELGHKPVYYFPDEDVRPDVLHPSDRHTHCPRKGEASYWSLRVDGQVLPNAVWYYPEPIASASFLAGHVAFYREHVEVETE
jgi:uncharacterized protein (DUF427 family)